MPETAIVRTVEEEAQLLEKQRLRTERKELKKQAHQALLDARVSQIKAVAAGHVALKRHMFKSEEELDAVVPKLTPQQRRIIRQWEEPKKATAFGVESSAKLMETEVRARAEKPSFKINVENAVISLPEKADETVEPVVIEVVAEDRK
jgi:hypothetical protein